MIHEANYLPVSVDKTYVFYKDHRYVANGFPTRIRVLSGTLLKYGNEFIKYVPREYRTASQDDLWKGESDSKVDLTGEVFLKFCNNTPIKKVHIWMQYFYQIYGRAIRFVCVQQLLMKSLSD